MLLVRQRERFWRFTRLMHMLVGAALIVASAFMQAADALSSGNPGTMTKSGYA
jgi:hypothetical protein